MASTPDVAEELRSHFREVRDLRRLAGGTSHETWACEADGEPVVVRRDVGEGVLDVDGDTEFVLLRTLHEHGLPVPRQRLRSGGLTVMERVAGEDVRKAMARDGVVADPGALGRRLVEAQAAIHAIEPPDPPGEAGLERWAGQIAEHAPEPRPLLDAAISWLRAHPPRPVAPRLIHADFKANNVLLSPDGRLTVIDWELAHLGDPVEDLAWTMLWDTRFDLVGGMLAPDEYIAEYERASGAPVDREALAYWQLFSLVKLAAIFLTSARPAAGRTPTLIMLGRAVPFLEHRIAGRLLEALDRGLA